MIKSFFSTIRNSLPTSYITMMWVATLLTFLWFDILWCDITSFRPFTHYISIYIVLIAAATIFTIPATLSRKRWPQIATLALLDSLFIANLLYARTYMVPIPLESYLLVGNLNGFGDSVINSFRWADCGFFVITLAAWCVTKRKTPGTLTTIKRCAYTLLLIGSVGASYTTIAGRGGFKERFSSMARSVNDQQSAVPVYTLFCTLAYDWLTLNEPLSPDTRIQTEQWFKKHNQLTATYVNQHANDSVTHPNLVILLCESLESWPIGLTVDGIELTPFLNSIIADTTVYYCPNVLTQVKDGRSIDGQLLYLSGRLPLTSGVYSMKYASTEYHSLPRAMKQHGAATYLLSADKPTTWNQTPVANAMGIDTLIMADDWKPWNPADAIIPDKELFNQSVNLMKSGELWPTNEYAFLMWVTHTGHDPFLLPHNASPIIQSDNYPTLLKDYINNVHYVDSALKTIVNYIKSRPDGDNTIITIVGDHEALASNRNAFANNYTWVSNTPFTPLILINSKHNGRDERVIGQVDVYSALLDAVGLYASYPWRGMGFSPFSTSHPGFAIGSTGSLATNAESIDSVTEQHLRNAYQAADIAMRYQLNVIPE